MSHDNWQPVAHPMRFVVDSRRTDQLPRHHDVVTGNWSPTIRPFVSRDLEQDENRHQTRLESPPPSFETAIGLHEQHTTTHYSPFDNQDRQVTNDPPPPYSF